jgi:hypothetical protein
LYFVWPDVEDHRRCIKGLEENEGKPIIVNMLGVGAVQYAIAEVLDLFWDTI